MKPTHTFATLLIATLAGLGIAVAQDRSLTVLETSVVVRGADVSIEGSNCDTTVRIDPIADQRPAQRRRLPAALCTSLRAALLRAAKLDQGVGDGGTP